MTLTSYDNIVYDTARDEGASDIFAKIILSQLKHESSNFTSRVFKLNNNPMGMKFPSKRKSPYISGKGTKPPGNEGATPYAKYNSLSDAVRDLFHWLSYNGIDTSNIQTVEDYSERLRQRGYMGNTQEAKRIYIAGLSRYLKSLSGATLGGGSILILFVALSAIIYLLTTIK